MSDFLGRGEPRIDEMSKFDAARLEASLPELIEQAKGTSWYEEAGTPVELATARLCLLRRARAQIGADAGAGDEAVRGVLAQADPEAVVWLLSRAVSFMDEQGFPDFVPGARAEG